VAQRQATAGEQIERSLRSGESRRPAQAQPLVLTRQGPRVAFPAARLKLRARCPHAARPGGGGTVCAPRRATRGVEVANAVCIALALCLQSSFVPHTQAQLDTFQQAAHKSAEFTRNASREGRSPRQAG
jgi:hypothetical protein